MNELQHQGGEDQHVTIKTTVLLETEVIEILENVVPKNFSQQTDQPSIARDRARCWDLCPKAS